MRLALLQTGVPLLCSVRGHQIAREVVLDFDRLSSQHGTLPGRIRTCKGAAVRCSVHADVLARWRGIDGVAAGFAEGESGWMAKLRRLASAAELLLSSGVGAARFASCAEQHCRSSVAGGSFITRWCRACQRDYTFVSLSSAARRRVADDGDVFARRLRPRAHVHGRQAVPRDAVVSHGTSPEDGGRDVQVRRVQRGDHYWTSQHEGGWTNGTVRVMFMGTLALCRARRGSCDHAEPTSVGLDRVCLSCIDRVTLSTRRGPNESHPRSAGDVDRKPNVM